MKAAVIYENGDPGVLRYEDVADPECPNGCVVVDAEAISIEGGDLLARAEGHLPAVPHVVGYLSAGTVSEVGAGVSDVAVGDRVVARSDAGSHASRRVVSSALTWPIPPGLVPSTPRASRSRSARLTSASSPRATSRLARPSLCMPGPAA